ncbi:hypothetical protein [Demequina sp. NBRC 110054]|uniref:hypothetical protein n=1 Tax=Demequina sp. NBRC 110054 TaxID=1570343 RepID=UPI000A01AA8B|nr:hypothetical protein [Demequina sp. NBRC 110054]
MDVGVLGDIPSVAELEATLDRFSARGISTILCAAPLASDLDAACVGAVLAPRGQLLYALSTRDDAALTGLATDAEGFAVLGDSVRLAPPGLRTTLAGRSVLWLGDGLTAEEAARVASEGHAELVISHAAALPDLADVIAQVRPDVLVYGSADAPVDDILFLPGGHRTHAIGLPAVGSAGSAGVLETGRLATAIW